MTNYWLMKDTTKRKLSSRTELTFLYNVSISPIVPYALPKRSNLESMLYRFPAPCVEAFNPRL